MQLNALQKAAAQAIVNIFETGSIRGNYADVTLIPGDSGQLTYGRSQTTLASGNLFLLIKDYAGRDDGAYCAQFRPYLPALEGCDPALNHDLVFRRLLQDAGQDPVMQDVQDAFFDRIYWDPAMRSADTIGAKSALGGAIVYDSTVHGSWAHVRDLTRQQFGELSDIGEKKWMAHYVDVRRNWLATFPNPLLHKTVYRMDAFKTIVGAGNWDLRLSFAVRGLTISPDSFSDTTPVRTPAEVGPKRLLQLVTPPMTGADVSWLQQRLGQAGIHVTATGSFDQQTEAAVRAFQESHDLVADGLVGPVTRAALEDLAVTAPSGSPEADQPMPSVARTFPVAVVQPIPATAIAPLPPTVAPVPVLPADAVADIKQHVSTEVRTGIESLRQSIRDVSGAGAQPAPAGAPKPPPGMTLQPLLSNARPLAAAGLSVIVLAFSQIRDALVWITGLPGVPSTPSAVHGAPPPPSPNPFIQAYQAVQAFAASLPSEWVYRIRIIGLALLCYVLYRLIARHFDIRKLQREIQAGEQLESQVASVLKPH